MSELPERPKKEGGGSDRSFRYNGQGGGPNSNRWNANGGNPKGSGKGIHPGGQNNRPQADSKHENHGFDPKTRHRKTLINGSNIPKGPSNSNSFGRPTGPSGHDGNDTGKGHGDARSKGNRQSSSNNFEQRLGGQPLSRALPTGPRQQHSKNDSRPWRNNNRATVEQNGRKNKNQSNNNNSNNNNSNNNNSNNNNSNNNNSNNNNSNNNNSNNNNNNSSLDRTRGERRDRFDKQENNKRRPNHDDADIQQPGANRNNKRQRGPRGRNQPDTKEQDNLAMPPSPPKKSFSMRTSSIFERLLQVGEGMYGKVYKAKNVDTGVIVALKKLRLESERDGMPITAIREIKILQSLRHQNVIALREMIVEKGDTYMALVYMEHDLTGILAHPTLTISHGNIKHMFKQMLEGLQYLHHKGILHRDIKGSNILVDMVGNVKIADFGLARFVDFNNRNAHYTNRVITLWYRPPEILLGATMYTGAIDTWGLGSLLIEMFTKRPVFQSQDEIGQMYAIYHILGTPDNNNWPEARSLPWYQMLLPKRPFANKFEETFRGHVPDLAMDLAEHLLAMNPSVRFTASQALAHEYFASDPLPEAPNLDNIGEWHDYEAKQRRKKAKEAQAAENKQRKELDRLSRAPSVVGESSRANTTSPMTNRP